MKTLDVAEVGDLRHVTARATTTGSVLKDEAAPRLAAALAPGEELGRKGSMVVRLARSKAEVEVSQRLRYKVFYEELDARPDEVMLRSGRDSDGFDEICDHLLVVDHTAGENSDPDLRVEDGNLVGTYRLLRQEVADVHGGFYTADEFDITPLIESRSDLRFLELGRSCVLAPYRTKPTVELLWQGIWNYVRVYGLDVMFGCASLEGVDPEALSLPLSLLHHHHRAPHEWRVRALPELYIEMNRMPAEEVNAREALRALPPLIKGYLRLGAYFGEGAVIDRQFNTTDVLIVLPVSAINERYFTHFGAPDAHPS